MDFTQTGRHVDKAIYNYNWMRPHQAINMKTPMQMLSEENRNPLLLSGATCCT
ncbi:MAG: hypothetical protein IKJ09_08365 [Bacteroidaceae bacterium]|nr:hypothetical protein [Bacteroidaceae bacterium]